jgi:hypothetical protein
MTTLKDYYIKYSNEDENFEHKVSCYVNEVVDQRIEFTKGMSYFFMGFDLVVIIALLLFMGFTLISLLILVIYIGTKIAVQYYILEQLRKDIQNNETRTIHFGSSLRDSLIVSFLSLGFTRLLKPDYDNITPINQFLSEKVLSEFDYNEHKPSIDEIGMAIGVLIIKQCLLNTLDETVIKYK